MIISIFVYLFTVISTHFLIKLLIAKRIIDHPNERSNHQKMVPRGGGLGFFIAILCAGIYLKMNIYLMVALAIVGTISFIDDIKNLNIIIRFAAQIIAASIFTYSLEVTLFLQIILILFLVGFMNCFNFMDGIDGISTIESIHITATIMIISYITGNEQLFKFAMIVCAANFGFLPYNFPPAKVFMGDIGSISLGLINGALVIYLFLESHYAASLIIPLYYLMDSGITLLLRIKRGEKFWQAHSKHFYQQAVRNGKSHLEVITRIGIINILLTFLAVYSLNHPKVSLVAAFVMICVFLKSLQR